MFKTAIDRHTEGVTVNVFYKHSRVKQYLKDGRAMRIETVINDAYDIGCQRLLPNLDEVQARARAINQRLLDTERVGQGTILASPAFERIAQPTVTDEGRRAPALRFGDPRVQALAGALANLLFATSGITNKSLRATMTALLGTAYSMNQASYDLARLRLNGLITPRPRPQPVHPHPRRPTVRHLLHQGPRPRPATAPRAPATNPTPRPNSAPHCAPSTRPSTNASPTPGSAQDPDPPPNSRQLLGVPLPKDR